MILRKTQYTIHITQCIPHYTCTVYRCLDRHICRTNMGTSYHNGTGAASKRRNNIYRANDGPFYVRLIFAAPLNPKYQGWWNLLGLRLYSSCASFTLLSPLRTHIHSPPHTTRFEHLLFGTIVVAVVFVIVAGAVVTFHFIFFTLFFLLLWAKFVARIQSRLGGDSHSHCQSTLCSIYALRNFSLHIMCIYFVESLAFVTSSCARRFVHLLGRFINFKIWFSVASQPERRRGRKPK